MRTEFFYTLWQKSQTNYQKCPSERLLSGPENVIGSGCTSITTSAALEVGAFHKYTKNEEMPGEARQSASAIYNGLHKNWTFAYFEKIGVAVSWVNIKVWLIPHLKAFTATFKLN